MFKRVLISLLLLCPLFSVAQDFSELWEGYFSYYTIKDVVSGGNKIYAASENAVFTYDLDSEELTTFSTISGLSGDLISTIYYSETFGALVIGYENGLMEIVLDGETKVLSVVDILEKSTIPSTSKRINHFNEYDGLLYMATNYGISVYDLSRLEFGDTYFIGTGGSQVAVNQTAILNGYIYAACIGDSGLKRADISRTDLINFDQWSMVAQGNFTAVEAVSENLFAVNTSRSIFKLVNNALQNLYQYADTPLDVKSTANQLVVTTSKSVFIYSSSFNSQGQVSLPEAFTTSFTAAHVNNEQVFVGSSNHGVLNTTVNTNTFEEIHPEGPLMNAAFSVEAGYNNLWVTFGDYTATFNPSPVRKRGVSHLKNTEWVNIPSDSVLEARNLNAISINPNKINQVFISSFQDGILEVNNDVATQLYTENNSGLETIENVASLRVSASTFDSDGVLWSLTGRVLRPLKSFNLSTKQWRSYSFEGLYTDALNGEWGFSDMVIDDSGVVWCGGYVNGLMGYDYNNGSPKIKRLSEESQNMPTSYVTAVALDRRNQIWIGTINGLRVLYNPSSFFSDSSVKASEIVILDDGIAKELLYQEYITDIEVDGTNNKWIATIGSGLFYFSSNGEETIYHFTKDNSPIPSNNITDVSIDSSTGKVFIATDNGLVAFKSGSSKPEENFESAYVYPNPVRPGFNITEDKVKIKGVSENVNIKITDVEGNLVAEAQSNVNSRFKGYNLEIDGGTVYWNGRNLANNVVRSGVYLIMLSDLDTYETKVLKLMVVR